MDTYSVMICFGADASGARFEELLRHHHVWLILAPDEHADWDALSRAGLDVSSFNSLPDESIDDSVLRALELVDDHHNEWHDPPGWNTIEVRGAAPSNVIRSYLVEVLGVTDLTRTASGFVCRRRPDAV